MQVYGDAEAVDQSTDLMALFHHPDVEVARQKLKTISEKLNVDLQEVPQFLEEYGDICLSIAYYRQCLDAIRPVVDNFLYCNRAIQKNNQFRHNSEVIKVCTRLERKVAKLAEVLADRFTVFAQSTEAMWQDMNADRFCEFKKLVEDNHAALGGLLCALSVKMDDWHRKFPDTVSSGPARWVDHILNNTRQGF